MEISTPLPRKFDSVTLLVAANHALVFVSVFSRSTSRAIRGKTGSGRPFPEALPAQTSRWLRSFSQNIQRLQ